TRSTIFGAWYEAECRHDRARRRRVIRGGAAASVVAATAADSYRPKDLAAASVAPYLGVFAGRWCRITTVDNGFGDRRGRRNDVAALPTPTSGRPGDAREPV